jgi:Flp pilus assembly protein TadG
MAALTLRRLATCERGAELIEMALVTPILLLLVMGIVDFGFLFQRYVVLTNAAVEGARMASMPGYTGPEAEDRAEAYAAEGGVPGVVTAVAAPVTLPGLNGGNWPGMQVTVTHVYQLQYIRPIITLVGGTSAANVTLTARSTMRSQLSGGS